MDLASNRSYALRALPLLFRMPFVSIRRSLHGSLNSVCCLSTNFPQEITQFLHNYDSNQPVGNVHDLSSFSRDFLGINAVFGDKGLERRWKEELAGKLKILSLVLCWIPLGYVIFLKATNDPKRNLRIKRYARVGRFPIGICQTSGSIL